MTDTGIENWHALLVKDTGSLREFREKAARLAGEVIRVLREGHSLDAEDAFAYLCLHQPEAFRPHWRALAEIGPDIEDWDATTAWAAADDAEIARLLEIARQPEGRDTDFARGCLLETRRPEILELLTRLEPDMRAYDLNMVGYGQDPDGTVVRVCPATVLHVAFPRAVVDEWSARRRDAPRSSWPVYSPGQGGRHLVSGFTDRPCPKCGYRLHRLLRLDPVPAGLGVSSRRRLEFTWCPVCTVYVHAWYTRHGPDGAADSFPDSPSIVDGYTMESSEDWFIPESPVGLVQLDERWRRQYWASNMDHENLHRVGGEPTWVQDPDYPACPGCSRTMPFVAQIANEDLVDGEGMCYLMWCDPCAISAVVYQQS